MQPVWPTGTGIRGRAVVLFGAMGPAQRHRNVFPASPRTAGRYSAGDTCVLDTGPGLCGFPWEILACTAVVVFIVKSGHTLRREKELAKGFAAR